jgi:hypothetical protein
VSKLWFHGDMQILRGKRRAILEQEESGHVSGSEGETSYGLLGVPAELRKVFRA